MLMLLKPQVLSKVVEILSLTLQMNIKIDEAGKIGERQQDLYKRIAPDIQK